MNKKGQFYIITAIILCVIIYGVSAVANQAEDVQLREDFGLLANNFLRETPKVANYAIRNSEFVSTRLDTFTVDFLRHARKTNPEVAVVYAFTDSEDLYIKSYEQEDVIVHPSSGQQTTLFGADEIAYQDITLDIGGQEFVHQVPVKVQYFGDDYVSLNLPSQDVTLEIGGAFHHIKVEDEPNIPKLKMILTSDAGVTEDVYTLGIGDEFSPTF